MTSAQITSNARIVVRELMSEPDALPLISACAVAGNGWQENFLRPVTIGARDHGSDGLLQWRLDRLATLQQRPNWNTLPVQCKYFKDECKAKYPTLWSQLIDPGNRTIENLTANICDMYERPSRAGRVIDKRIDYAKQVLALHDAQAPEPQTIPPVLEPVVNGIGSTVFGGLCWIVSALLYYGVNIGITDANWQTWFVIGLAMIFFIGGRSPQPSEEEPLASQPQEVNMNPEVIMRLLTVIETFVPVIEKIVNDIPALQNDVAQIKSALVQTQQPNENINTKMQELMQKLNELAPRG